MNKSNLKKVVVIAGGAIAGNYVFDQLVTSGIVQYDPTGFGVDDIVNAGLIGVCSVIAGMLANKIIK